MIKKIHITNFKGIKDTVSLDLKPITLLFGPNSAGKSSIIQAIHYLKEILERKNFDPKNTAYGGKALNLGGFKNLIHNHNLKLPLFLSVELDLSKTDLPEAQEIEDKENSLDYHSYSRFSQKSNSCKLTVQVQWLENLERAEATNYEVEINEELLGSISLDYTNPKNIYAYFDKINIDHAIEIDEYDDSKRGGLFAAITGGETDNYRIKIDFPRSVIPHWERGVILDSDNFIASQDADDWFDNENAAEGIIENYSKMMKLICQVMTGVGKYVLLELDKFRYIGPIREIPSRNFDAHFSGEIERWADGLAAWDLIYSKKIPLDILNNWLEKLKTGFKLNYEKYLYLNKKQLTSLSEDIKHQLIEIVNNSTEESELDLPLLKQGFSFELIKELSGSIERIFTSLEFKSDILTKEEVYLVDKNTEIPHKPYDIGVGISQSLPVIVGALYQKESILAVEQPELHLHPAVQVEMADLFISQINEKTDVIYLLETHSEHLMLRFLRRIEETYKNKIKEEKLKLIPQKINVFVIPEGIPMKGYSLPIDKTGEFEKEWPNGFFEEREEELFPDD